MSRTRFALVLFLAAANLHAGFIAFTGTGAGTAASIAAFEAAIGGANNGSGGPQVNGFRTINWDAVPAPDLDPNPLPGNFFQGRGVELPGSGLEATNTGFSEFNASYPALFPAFSSPNIFASTNTNFVIVNFVVPGSTTAAATRGFGAVFLDVNNANQSGIDLIDAGSNVLGSFFASSNPGGPSFLGLVWDGSGPQIGSVELHLGNGLLDFGLNQSIPSNDLVALDDFAFGEPQAIAAAPEPATFLLVLPILAALMYRNRRCQRSPSL